MATNSVTKILHSEATGRRSLVAKSPTAVVVVDVLYNLVLIILTIVFLAVSGDEHPNKPIRAWLGVYLGQCVVHVILALYAAKTKKHEGGADKLISLNNFVARVWWIVGLVWVISGGDKLHDRAPRLFWLSVVFLGLHVISTVLFCFVMPCLLCCCVGFFAGALAAQDDNIPEAEVVDLEKAVEAQVEKPSEVEKA